MPPFTRGRMKGAALKPVLGWYVRTYGEDAIREAMTRLPAELHAEIMLENGMPKLLPTVWYDVRLAHALVDETLGQMPADERPRLAREAARAGVAESARGVYRFVIAQATSPELYARHVQRLWRLLHDDGTREIRMLAPGEAVSEIRDWPGHHPILCVLTNETMAALFEVMGARDVRVERELCVSEHASLCRTHVSWRMR